RTLATSLGLVACLALAACASTAPARNARAAGAPEIVAQHRVEEGETAFGIARRYGVSVEALAQVNELRDPSRLFVGRVLDIPAPSDATEDADETTIEVERRTSTKTTETRAADGTTTRETATKTLTQLTERTTPKSDAPKRTDAKATAKDDPKMSGEGARDVAAAKADATKRTDGKTTRDDGDAKRGDGKRTGVEADAPAPRPSNRAQVDPARIESAKEAARQGDLGKLQEEMRPRRAEGVPEGCDGVGPAPTLAVDRYIWPVDGVVISSFGKRDGLPHEGIDIAAPIGTPIWAARAGTVLYSGEQAGYGQLVILRHEGDQVSIYAHNARNCVAEGAAVEQGQVIGLVGATGGATSPSVHFELRIGNKTVNPRAHLIR
ncbi:peptidoglycan DD-metalloendopeptidase family protein, partial [Myxococcota bacterium]|nr:peptidoglycan DD-metalloendopeptidase family protein [Myxococcota bacterium]